MNDADHADDADLATFTAISEDGKTRTTTIRGTDVKGQPVDIVSFYEKQ